MVVMNHQSKLKWTDSKHKFIYKLEKRKRVLQTIQLHKPWAIKTATESHKAATFPQCNYDLEFPEILYYYTIIA